MKKIFFLFAILPLLVACNKSFVEIKVENKLALDRKDEMVEFCLCSVKEKLHLKDSDQIIIVDVNGQQVPYQILSDNTTVIFPAEVAANSTSVYHVQIGTPHEFPIKTFARQVTERKDDFAWENDRIAFRMYGPALASENPSNGVDVWLKRTDSLIVNKFYKNELENGISYHVDNGEGLDCYKVGHTLGAGGVAPYVNDSLWVGSNYNSCKVLETGPLRTIFQLAYDTLRVDKNTLKSTLTITVDAGTQLNKATVSYESTTKMPLAAGIFLHDSIGNIKMEKEKGYMAYAENAVSDAGIPSGRSYVGVVLYNISEAKQKGKHILAISNEYNEPFTYYFGAGWSKWGFETDNDWFAYMEQAAEKIKNPLIVTVK